MWYYQSMDVKKILKTYGVSITGPRVQILELLDGNDCCYSQSDIFELLDKAIDKTTIYRTLYLLEKKGVVLRSCGRDRIERFGICRDSKGMLFHPHFHCKVCDRRWCLREAIVNITQGVPKDFVILQQDVSLDGLCSSCSVSMK